MKPAFFQIGEKPILPQKIQHPLHNFYVILAFIFGVNKDVIQVNNYKNIEFFGQDLIDVALKAGRSIR